MNKSQKRKANKTRKLTLGITLAVVILILLVFSLSKDSARQQETKNVTDTTQQNTTTKKSKSNYNTINKSDWKGAEKAQEIINSTQNQAPNEETINNSIIQDPDDENIFYFATELLTFSQEDPNKIETAFTGIYKYNTKSYNWERIHKSKITPTNNIHHKTHVLGFTNNKLILQIIESDYSPGPCSTPWLAEKSETKGFQITSGLKTLDLNNPYNKFEDYKLDNKTKQEKQQNQQDCESEIFNN